MIEGSPELNEDINSKKKINQWIEYQKLNSSQLWRLKTEFKWYKEAIIERQNNNKQLPLGLPWIILTDHKLLFLIKQQPIYRFSKFSHLLLKLLEPRLLSYLDFIHLLLLLPFDALLFFKIIDLLIMHQIHFWFFIAEQWLLCDGFSASQFLLWFLLLLFDDWLLVICYDFFGVLLWRLFLYLILILTLLMLIWTRWSALL